MCADIPHSPAQPCCVCRDDSWCSCGGCSECQSIIGASTAGLREPHGEVPDDGAIAEIVDALERGDNNVGL